MNETIHKRLLNALQDNPTYRIRCIQGNIPAPSTHDNYTPFDLTIAHKAQEVWLWTHAPQGECVPK